MAKSSFTKHLGIFHRRDAETAETSQRGGGKRPLIPSLRSLCVLCVSAVNSRAIFLALLSFQLWPFSVKEFLATYLAALDMRAWAYLNATLTLLIRILPS